MCVLTLLWPGDLTVRSREPATDAAHQLVCNVEIVKLSV